MSVVVMKSQALAVLTVPEDKAWPKATDVVAEAGNCGLPS